MHKKIVTRLSQKIGLAMLGLFLFFVFLEIALRLAGFIMISAQDYRNRLSLKKGSFKIICLGESTTALGGKKSYPSYLEEILNENNLGMRFSVINKGLCGIKTKNVIVSLDNNLRDYHPDMVIAMIGINDKGMHMPKENLSLPFLEQLKVYKMLKLVWQRILIKRNETINSRLSKVMTLVYIDKNAAGGKSSVKVSIVKAEQLLKKEIIDNPGNFMSYYLLGQIYALNNRWADAETALRKTVEINPFEGNAYIGLGYIYVQEDKISEAIDCFKKAVECDPSLAPMLWYRVGCLYRDKEDLVKAEGFLKASAALDPGFDGSPFDLGWIYRTLGRLDEAEKEFKRAQAINPRNPKVYDALGWLYRDQGRVKESEEMFKQAIAYDSINDKYYANLAVLYGESGSMAASEKYTQKVEALRELNDNFSLRSNYRLLKAALDKRKIPLVCVQYPMRKIYPLKRVFTGTKGVIFVDNEKIFKDAVGKESYQAYFSDMFAGDFGHCTPKGNRLLAENIAKTVLKEYFHENNLR